MNTILQLQGELYTKSNIVAMHLVIPKIIHHRKKYNVRYDQPCKYNTLL